MDCSVLIVDDSPLLRATMKRAVVEAGIDDQRIREAGNGRDALEALGQEPADLVLLDLDMPVMDASHFVEQIAEAPELAAVHVVVVATVSSKHRLPELEARGVSAFLPKPFEPEELREVLAELLGC